MPRLDQTKARRQLDRDPNRHRFVCTWCGQDPHASLTDAIRCMNAWLRESHTLTVCCDDHQAEREEG